MIRFKDLSEDEVLQNIDSSNRATKVFFRAGKLVNIGQVIEINRGVESPSVLLNSEIVSPDSMPLLNKGEEL